MKDVCEYESMYTNLSVFFSFNTAPVGGLFGNKDYGPLYFFLFQLAKYTYLLTYLLNEVVLKKGFARIGLSNIV